MNKGFTLIELSIVLVIIGLLIGGILSAQSMINTAKISSQVRQFGQFDAAVENFVSRYNSLPGDSVAFGVGNGDGLITSNGGNFNMLNNEIANFWRELSLTGLKVEGGGSSYSNDYTTGMHFSGSNANAPKGKVGKTSAIVAWGYNGSFYGMADCSVNNNDVLRCDETVPGADALALDIKMDNGVINTGNFQGFLCPDCSLGSSNGIIADSMGATDSPETSYNVSSVYFARIRMGAVTGNLK